MDRPQRNPVSDEEGLRELNPFKSPQIRAVQAHDGWCWSSWGRESTSDGKADGSGASGALLSLLHKNKLV